VFASHSLTIRVPRAMLQNDDGFLNAAAIVGSIHHPTDFVPQTGHLTLGAPALAVASRMATVPSRLRTNARAWGRR
jgi:hypothetical protein